MPRASKQTKNGVEFKVGPSSMLLFFQSPDRLCMKLE